jgi:hypothetical protein
MEYQKINIQDHEGKIKEVNFITTLSSEEYNAIYLVYSEKEITDDENEICIAKIVEENEMVSLEQITDPDELKEVENLINEGVVLSEL